MEIECEFPVTRAPNYDCEVPKASIISPNVDIVRFKGNHLPGKNNNDVTRIIFRSSPIFFSDLKLKVMKVEYFPRNLQKIFPNLNTLVIFNCGLKEISRQDLIGLENLVDMDLSCNKIKSLPDDLFKNMPNLKRVSLDSNQIEFASSKLIDPTVKNQLESFNLRSNTSINEFYHRGAGTCKSIQELMTKIDEKCKPPEPAMVSKAVQTDLKRVNAAEEILKVCNEFRLLGLHTDFAIIVGSKEFPVNKIILASQSSVFDEMFKVKTHGRFASKLEISEMSQQAVEAFLHYLYERKQPKKENAAGVFKLAAKYDVTELKAICEEIIRDGLDESNAFEVFKLASNKSEELKVAAFRKLQEIFGNELGDDLLDNPENLQEIVETKKRLDDLVKKSRK